MATLTSRLPIVNGSGRPGGQAKTRTQVAGSALGRQRHIGVQLARSPARVTRLVAGIAIGDGHPRQRRIRDVGGTLAGGWRKTTRMAGRALVGDGLLGVIPLGRLPRRGAVAAHAVHGGGHVLCVLATGG